MVGELHDTVAHAVSIMIIQGGASEFSEALAAGVEHRAECSRLRSGEDASSASLRPSRTTTTLTACETVSCNSPSHSRRSCTTASRAVHRAHGAHARPRAQAPAVRSGRREARARTRRHGDEQKQSGGRLQGRDAVTSKVPTVRAQRLRQPDRTPHRARTPWQSKSPRAPSTSPLAERWPSPTITCLAARRT